MSIANNITPTCKRLAYNAAVKPITANQCYNMRPFAVLTRLNTSRMAKQYKNGHLWGVASKFNPGAFYEAAGEATPRLCKNELTTLISHILQSIYQFRYILSTLHKKIMNSMFVLVVALFCGCSDGKEIIGDIVNDPNTVQLSRVEVAIVRAVDAKFKEIDIRLADVEAQQAVLKQALVVSDPNLAL